MKRSDWSGGRENPNRKCDECGQNLRSWNTGWSGDVKCKDCYKIIVEAVALQKIEERAYYLHIENPQRSAEENWRIADAEAEEKRFDKMSRRRFIIHEADNE